LIKLAHTIMLNASCCSERSSVRITGDADADARLAPIMALPHAIALAIDLAHMAGLDADAPQWAGAYDKTSRGTGH
jgi:hypothetical protein